MLEFAPETTAVYEPGGKVRTKAESGEPNLSEKAPTEAMSTRVAFRKFADTDGCATGGLSHPVSLAEVSGP